MSTHATDSPTFAPGTATDSDTDYGAMLRWAATVATSPAIDELILGPARSWVPLAAPGGWDAWLIAWPGGSATGWHDHQGAAGVFYVARGVLSEFSVAGGVPSSLFAVVRPSPSGTTSGPVGSTPAGAVPSGRTTSTTWSTNSTSRRTRFTFTLPAYAR